jgi:hypothetical protein
MALSKNRRTVTLPVSKETVEIRKLKAIDFMAGGLPDPIRELRATAQKEGRPITEAEKEAMALNQEVMTYNIGLVLAAVTKHPEGSKIVLKMPNDCAEGEFSWHDLDEEDQAALQAAVFGFVREGAAQAAAFS